MIVLTVDQVDSRHGTDLVQGVLDGASRLREHGAVLGPDRTAGDEFQLVFRDARAALGTALLPWLAVTYGFRAVFGVLALFCFVTAAATWRWLHGPDELPAPGAAAAAALVVALPRAGWACVALALLAWVAAAQPGLGVLVAVALAPVPLLVRRAAPGCGWTATSTPATACPPTTTRCSRR